MSAGPVEAAGLARAAPAVDARRLREAAEAFEALLIESLLRTMREAQLEDGLFGRGPGASIYESMFDAHVAGRLARGSPFGVARALEQSWAPRLEPAGGGQPGPDAVARPDLKSGMLQPIGTGGQRPGSKPHVVRIGGDENDGR